MRGSSIRQALASVSLALAGSVALPLAVSASDGTQQVTVPAQSVRETHVHACADGSGGTCVVDETFTDTAHTEFRAGSALDVAVGARPAGACTTNYGWPTYQVDDHNYYGMVVTSVVLSGENYWDGCTSSGWVWVDLACTAQPGYSCGAGTHGNFWDGGLGASTAWGNQATSNFCCSVMWYLRMDAYPSGQLTRRYSN